ncbi:MAG: UvrD-helicase domain-containing protein [Acidobacteria bacterium]|nr:UvrD-helicase domain-containing protein [Acidobacteriota bacterium]
MSHLLDQLNTQQRTAVEHSEGPALILAGAGSGKTRVITYRIAHLIGAKGIPPESILAVTFTNKAADQMKERVAHLLSDSLESWPHISTFHSFCVRVLRRNIEGALPGYTRDFSIYDEDDQARLVKTIVNELGLGEQAASPRSLLARISYAKNRGLAPQDLYRQAADAATEKLATVFERYERKLRQANALDFDDLLLKTVELLYAAKDVCERYNQRFRYVLVDEYQDTSRIQYQLIRQLTLIHQNLCVVGDEDQSIYRWRGAEIENILNFERDYPGARLIRLEQNYRSTQVILDAATAVVSRNRARKGKVLWTDRAGGARVGLYEAQSADEEAFFIAAEIQRTLAADGDATIAVLYRTNSQSRLFEEALRRLTIGYRVVGGFSFYERAEVKDLLSYARLATNLRDSAALLRVINTPARGIGDTTVQSLQASARRANLSLWEALEQDLAAKLLPARSLRVLENFYNLVSELAAARGQMTMSGFFREVLERTNYLETLRAEGTPEAESRIENLQELVNAAAEAEDRGETLAEFLDHAALVSAADDFEERARVTLMSLHSAKGLEFSVVFLAGLVEGLFPHKLSMDDDAALEEERRLCYVGMTRARDRLILTRGASRRSFAREDYETSPPSRFLREVPSELIETLNLAMTGVKPRTTWENAVSSRADIERFLRERRSNAWNPGSASAGAGETTRSTSRWKLGSPVRHPKFGLGTILGCEGEGEDSKLTVSFPGYGKKKFVEKFAALEKI